MTLEEFKASIKNRTIPTGLTPELEALWQDASGNWDKAHELVQEAQSGNGAWIHAYLHRKEGDLANARYWYRCAGRTQHKGPLEAEWTELIGALLPSA